MRIRESYNARLNEMTDLGFIYRLGERPSTLMLFRMESSLTRMIGPLLKCQHLKSNNDFFLGPVHG